MKKSHRRDVIIARIIFAVFLLALIAAIAWLVSFALSRRTPKPDTQTETETETQQYFVIDPNQENTEEPETETQISITVQTTRRVNLRTEPNTDCEVITVLETGTVLELQEESDGWALVVYDDQTGYVSTDYIIVVEQSENE
jgi:cytoskeletal protein RodZ